MTGVPLEEVALSIASEFGPIDAQHARRELNVLAVELGPIDGLDPQQRVQRLIGRLGGDDGFEVPVLAGPEDLMLDRVLRVRRGHPVALAILELRLLLPLAAPARRLHERDLGALRATLNWHGPRCRRAPNG